MRFIRVGTLFLAVGVFACSRSDGPSTQSAVGAAAPAATATTAPDAATQAPGSTTDPAGENPEIPALTAADLTRPWAKLVLPHANVPPQVGRGPDGFVAVLNERTPTGGKGEGPAWNYLYRSADGITWHRLPSVEQPGNYFRFGGITYGAGRYVLVGYGQMWTSTDLAQWSKPLLQEDRDGGDVAALDVGQVVRLQGKFFGLGTNALWLSNDGLSWSRIYIPIVQARSIAFGNGTFVVGGALSIRTSSDGTTWAEHSPSCTTPGAKCLSPPGGGQSVTEIATVTFLQDRFYTGHLMSTDGATWQTYDGPVVNEVVGSYLFNFSYAGDHYGEDPELKAWRPNEAVHPIVVEPPVASTMIVGGVGPETITTPLPGGETCLTHRCVIVGGVLYLLR